jgi:hypothetical protein
MTFRATVGHTDGAERVSVPVTFRLTRAEIGVLLAAHPMLGRPPEPRISSLEEHIRAVVYERGMSATWPTQERREENRDWATVQLGRLWPPSLADVS